MKIPHEWKGGRVQCGVGSEDMDGKRCVYLRGRNGTGRVVYSDVYL
jgi:hypothetical protein